jgi:N-acetylglucosaminyl-diphospho-decaprenol L-rhamnosyltransferase
MMKPSETTVRQQPDPLNRMVVFAVIVTHHGSSEMLDRCLDSISRAGGMEQIVVVDNSGGADAPAHGGAETIDSLRVENRGFGAAVNAGVDFLRSQFDVDDSSLVVVLNDDVEVTEGWLDPLIDAFGSDPSVGAVQPKLLLAGTDPAQVNGVGVRLDRSGAGVDIGFGELDGTMWEGLRPIDIFTGGAVVLRSSVLHALGGFDERYFLYYEDVDLALRGCERGWRYVCEPASVVWHAPGSTTIALGDQRRYLQERNRIWVAGRFDSPEQLWRALWLSIRRLRHTPRAVHAKALVGGVAGLPQSFLARWQARRKS